MLKGWLTITARTALSRNASKAAPVPRVITCGGEASVPSGVSRITIRITTFSATGGTDQFCFSRARSASSSFCDSVAAVPVGMPSEAVRLMASPVAA